MVTVPQTAPIAKVRTVHVNVDIPVGIPVIRRRKKTSMQTLAKTTCHWLSSCRPCHRCCNCCFCYRSLLSPPLLQEWRSRPRWQQQQQPAALMLAIPDPRFAQERHAMMGYCRTPCFGMTTTTTTVQQIEGEIHFQHDTIYVVIAVYFASKRHIISLLSFKFAASLSSMRCTRTMRV